MTRLGDLIAIKHGFAFLGEHFGDFGSHVVLTPGNFLEEGGFISKAGKEKWYRGPVPSEYVLHTGDLLVAMTEQAEGLLGSSLLVPEDDRYLHNQRLGLVQVREPHRTDTRFLYYLFNHRPIRQQIRGSASGTKIRHTSPTRIADVKALVPQVAVQRRIASILSAYDDLIENCQRRIRILEDMARGLYREWFVHFRFPGADALPRVDSPLGLIPSGWLGQLGDLASLERKGISPIDHADEAFEHFSIPAFDDGRRPVIEKGRLILSGKYLIDETVVLLSKLNPRIPRVWLPAPSGLGRAVTSTEFLVLRPSSGSSREFVYSKFVSDDFAAHFSSRAIGTSTSHQRVKPGDLMTLPSCVPDVQTVERFTSAVAPLFASQQILRAQITNLRRTRDLLLPRLLSGQITLASAEPEQASFRAAGSSALA